jgi:hypothetical protein
MFMNGSRPFPLTVRGTARTQCGTDSGPGIARGPCRLLRTFDFTRRVEILRILSPG